MDGVVGIVGDFVAKYQKTTEPKIKIVDTFLAYVLGVGLLVFAYCFIFGTFPFNSFLAGFLSTVGVFVTTVSLRLHLTDSDFKNRSEGQAFAEYVLCNLVLFLAAFNFIG